jgi:hypothetical protein
VNYREPKEDRRARSGWGIIGGYVGFFFGLLVVLSMASEVQALPMHIGAVVVFIHMVAGYAIGWLIQPLINALFPQ